MATEVVVGSGPRDSKFVFVVALLFCVFLYKNGPKVEYVVRRRALMKMGTKEDDERLEDEKLRVGWLGRFAS